jgi:hypothetical protein
MNSVNYKNLVREKTRTTADTFTDASILNLTNTYIEEIAGAIQRMRPNVWNVPAQFNLIADQREYSFPQDVLNSLNSLEIKFGADEKFVRVKGLKERPKMALNEEDIRTAYENDPSYFIRRKAIYLLTKEIPSVTNGGLLTFNAFPAMLPDLTGTDDMSIDPSTTTHGFPREFHELLARRVSIAYKDSKELPLNREEQNYETDLEKRIEEFASPEDQTMEEIISMPSGNTLGDNGYNY